VPPSTIRIVAGESGRRKVVEVDGLAPAVLKSLWPGLDV